jgi:hypothetical protein
VSESEGGFLLAAEDVYNLFVEGYTKTAKNCSWENWYGNAMSTGDL